MTATRYIRLSRQRRSHCRISFPSPPKTRTPMPRRFRNLDSRALVQISLAGATESRRQHWIRQRAPRSKSQARFCPSLEAS